MWRCCCRGCCFRSSSAGRGPTLPVCCCLGGKIGILELIADYVGIARGRDLRVLRSLIGPLTKYLEEVPEGGLDPGGNSVGSDEDDDETDEEEDEE